MVFAASDLAIIFSAIAVLFSGYAAYRNSVRKAEFEKLQARVVETEKRLADAERRASDNERRAFEYRNDVIQIGEAIETERKENARRLALIAEDANGKINKVVLVLEKVINDFEAAAGRPADVDIEALKRLVVLDHFTGQLGPIDVQAVKRYEQTR